MNRPAERPPHAPAVTVPAESLRPLFDRLRTAQSRHVPGLAERRAKLAKLERAVVAYREDIVQAISADFGRRSRIETLAADVMTVLTDIRHSRRKLRGWMKPERRGVNWPFLPARGEIRVQPLGVVGIVAPWNYPFQLAMLPLANAIAAGNRVMLKPSEMTP